MRRKLWAGLVMVLMFVVITGCSPGGWGDSSSSNTTGDILAGSFNNLST